jgi:hypothetical protein
LKDVSSLKVILTSDSIFTLSGATISKLAKVELIGREGVISLIRTMSKEFSNNLVKEFMEAHESVSNNEFDKARVIVNRMIKSLEGMNSNPLLNELPALKAFVGQFGFILVASYQLTGNIDLLSKNFQDATLNYNKALRAFDKIPIELVNDEILDAGKMRVLTTRIASELMQANQAAAVNSFSECLGMLRDYKSSEIGIKTLTHFVVTYAYRMFGPAPIRELISASDPEMLFFPVIRAIDYLETNDEVLIERLSPEIRIVVQEIVNSFRISSQIQEEELRYILERRKKNRSSKNSESLDLPQ